MDKENGEVYLYKENGRVYFSPEPPELKEWCDRQIERYNKYR